jgi:hypothetical protein
MWHGTHHKAKHADVYFKGEAGVDGGRPCFTQILQQEAPACSCRSVQDLHPPVVDDQEREDVHLEQPQEAVRLPQGTQAGQDRDQGQVTDDDLSAAGGWGGGGRG